MTTLIVYGTLRTQGRLRPFYKLNTIKLEDKLSNYYMIDSNWGYPIAFEGDKEDVMTVEVTEVEDSEYLKIYNMERLAGYTAEKVKTDSGLEGYIFIQDLKNRVNNKIYDWIKYCKETL